MVDRAASLNLPQRLAHPLVLGRQRLDLSEQPRQRIPGGDDEGGILIIDGDVREEVPRVEGTGDWYAKRSTKPAQTVVVRDLKLPLARRPTRRDAYRF